MRVLRRIQYNSPVVLTFALVSLVVLGIGELTDGASTTALFCVYRSPLTDPLTYPRLFLHVLGHANYEHYMGNMLLMLVVGPPLEEKYGSRSLLLAIVITAFASGLVQWICFPGQGLLGASGIVFMMIVMASLSGMRGGAIPLTLIFVVIFYLGGEIVDGILKADNISQLTHIVGGVCGAVIGYVLARRRL
jgi:rhomboid protease GluP